MAQNSKSTHQTSIHHHHVHLCIQARAWLPSTAPCHLAVGCLGQVFSCGERRAEEKAWRICWDGFVTMAAAAGVTARVLAVSAPALIGNANAGSKLSKAWLCLCLLVVLGWNGPTVARAVRRAGWCNVGQPNRPAGSNHAATFGVALRHLMNGNEEKGIASGS